MRIVYIFYPRHREIRGLTGTTGLFAIPVGAATIPISARPCAALRSQLLRPIQDQMINEIIKQNSHQNDVS